MQMFNYMIQADNADSSMRDLAGRIEAMQYNLAVQRGDTRSATDTLARMFGQWLQNLFSR